MTIYLTSSIATNTSITVDVLGRGSGTLCLVYQDLLKSSGIGGGPHIPTCCSYIWSVFTILPFKMPQTFFRFQCRPHFCLVFGIVFCTPDLIYTTTSLIQSSYKLSIIVTLVVCIFSENHYPVFHNPSNSICVGCGPISQLTYPHSTSTPNPDFYVSSSVYLSTPPPPSVTRWIYLERDLNLFIW